MAANHMWMSTFKEAGPQKIEINFVQAVQVTGLRVWNYNESFEDSFKGVSGLIFTVCMVMAQNSTK